MENKRLLTKNKRIIKLIYKMPQHKVNKIKIPLMLINRYTYKILKK